MKALHLPLAFALVTPVFSQSIVSPEVHSDGTVTFRVKAPNATEVRLQCESLPNSPMQKDDQGVWTATTTPLEPDYYGYSFSVDGLRVIDPNNPLMKYNLLNTESEVHVPGPASLPWEINDVPRGVIHRHTYHSPAANDERAYFVYTPPGYNPTSRKRYPALYLLHGFSDDATAWWSVGRANVILDNLIARGEVKPMIVVMPLGYGTLEILHRGFGRPRDPDLSQRNARQFRASLLDEVLPRVEKEYRISADRKSRAIAGLSMGGAESITVGLNNLDRFAWIGAFSSGGVDTNYAAAFPNLNAKANDSLRLLWISCGKDDGLLKPNLDFVHWLDTEGIQHTWTEVPGVHSWRVWRRNLATFTPLLFR
ncbi:MAG TPA: alpha/beta hydrolase-fold protein [Candidatus Baltobacteraceae bacterium]|jgi:enterochelin esterase family protein|nr:alpha/beta hydrolase-fold protein [Candidatus Baltobacteraceae bacterium]